MNSKTVKAQVFSFLRFKKNIHHLATEVGAGTITDILGYKDGKFTEVEVKTSISDLKVDFAKLSYKTIKKHDHYAETKDVPYFRPHYFYFAVPEDLLEKSTAVIESLGNKKYGIISVSETGVKIARPARLLRPKDSKTYRSDTVALDLITMRATSELASAMRVAAGLPKLYK